MSGNRETLKERFQDSYSAHVDRMRDVLKRFGLPLIEINTVDDPLDQLLRALGGYR